MRISARTDYAIQALAYIAADGGDRPVKAETIAHAQEIPLKFLLGILRELKNAHLLRSQRGAEGGYTLTRPPSQITLAEVFRVLDGPLANVRDTSLSSLAYTGAARKLPEVWKAVRASLRAVLDVTTIEDLATGSLPASVRELAADYTRQIRQEQRAGRFSR